MANIHKTTVRLKGDVAELINVLQSLAAKAQAVAGETTFGPLRCEPGGDEGVVVELRGICADAPPLDFVKVIAGDVVEVSVHSVELSNAWVQGWIVHEGEWALQDCREKFFPDDEPDGEERVYVENGQVLREPLPEWVAAR